MRCEIKSSCSLLGCQHTDPMTVDPDSSITRNCSISTGKRAQGMTWKQARQEIQNSTGLPDLVLLQSKSTKDFGNMSCDCTNINFARRCFFGCSVVNRREWLCNDPGGTPLYAPPPPWCNKGLNDKVSFRTLTKQKKKQQQQQQQQ